MSEAYRAFHIQRGPAADLDPSSEISAENFAAAFRDLEGVQIVLAEHFRPIRYQDAVRL